MSHNFSTTFRAEKKMVTGTGGAVVSQHRRASEAGVDILRAGGNAVDAAIATAFSLAVLEPWMSGLGGGGYMLVGRRGDTPKLIDFNMRSPAAINPEDYPLGEGSGQDLFPWPDVPENRNTRGPLAICAPTMVPGMDLAWRRFGSLPWAALLEPAIQFSSEGLLVDWYTQLILSSAASELHYYKTASSLYLEESGSSVASGWTALSQSRIHNSALNLSLIRIAERGVREIVDGTLARQLVEDIQSLGAVLTLDDFSSSPPTLTDPSGTIYHGRKIWSSSKFSGGETLIKIINSMNRNCVSLELENGFYGTIADIVVPELQQRVESLGDCDTNQINPSCTTHFCTSDEDGLIVSATLTLVSMFGSKVMSPQTGVMLNNGMSWFDPVPGRPNSIGPAKYCLNNMAPTLIQNGEEAIALGAAGGRKIVPALAQLTAFLVQDGLTFPDALRQPRLDIAADGTIIADDRIRKEELLKLENQALLHTAPMSVFPYNFGIVSALRNVEGRNDAMADLMAPWADAAVVH